VTNPQSPSFLDLPAYSIGDAAHYLKLPYATVRSWVVGYDYRVTKGQQRFRPVIEIPDDKSGFLSFRNVVELHVLSAIRRQHKVRLKEVRAAVAYLKDKFGNQHPLADQQMSTNGTDLFVERYGQLINASKSGQLAMRDVLAEYLDRIERSADGIPLRLYPFSGRSESKVVVIDPEIRFGKPCVSGSGIPTVLIADRFYAGETISDLARDYGRKEIEIEEAIRFEQAAA
jgi:uncharacterized protein (DUF433 family)